VDQRTLDVLELPKVLDRLAAHTSFSLGRERALELRPSFQLQEVADRQEITQEARRLIELKSGVTLGGAHDVRPLVRRTALGGRLEPGELLDVRDTLAASRVLRRTILPLRDQVPRVADIAEGLADRAALEDEISRCISEKGEVLDAASATLARLRSETKVAYSRLMDQLNRIISSSTYADVIQDAIITVRDGRYVIPIRAEARNKFRSIVHDQSQSGATLFVEPFQTVELNNRWRELQLEEEREVARILQELSNLIGASADAILEGVERLGDVDLALACARFAGALNAVQPRLFAGAGRDEEAELRLNAARHPLLTGDVVPTTIRLGGDFSALVITGPNTGGKTVALKTVGLLTMMALAGLHIPAGPGSSVRVFDAVYADIGDEQSIEQSLSTFSGHMTQIISILGQATDRSLVLLDELGAGTDPGEGSALARAILDELLERGSLVVATTHYAELKSYAHTTPGVANASVEFDVETLSPTYRLSIGLPGRSNALAIARRLGLSDQVLERARGLVSDDEVKVESLLADIQAERDRSERARQSAEREHKRVADLARQLSKRISDLEREKATAVRNAHAQAETELADLRERLRELAARIERGEAQRDTLAPLVREVKAAETELVQRRPAPSPAAPAAEAIAVGAWVKHRRLGSVGQVTAIAGGQADVQVGSFKMKARLDELERASRREREAQEPRDYPSYSMPVATGPIPQSQIEIRGWRADQVGPELDKYLNDAYLAGLPAVRIVHGKGTGVLRQVVRDYLARHPLVRSFETAERREGGDGVTVAALAN
jgi:DNA mismatch repair protein MutS2